METICALTNPSFGTDVWLAAICACHVGVLTHFGDYEEVWGARDGVGPTAICLLGAPTREAAEPAADPGAKPSGPDAAETVQVKVWLLGISPMVWRRLLVPDTCSLRGLHGAIQVAMG